MFRRQMLFWSSLLLLSAGPRKGTYSPGGARIFEAKVFNVLCGDKLRLRKYSAGFIKKSRVFLINLLRVYFTSVAIVFRL